MTGGAAATSGHAAMAPLFKVRWPTFAKVEALLLFGGILAAAHNDTALTSVLTTLTAAGAALLSVDTDVITWAALGCLLAGPCFWLLLAADRLLGVRHGFAVLSILAIAGWTAIAAAVSPDLAGLLPNVWSAGNGWDLLSVTIGIGLLIHARPIWIGINHRGFVAMRLASAAEDPGAAPNPRGSKRRGRVFDYTLALAIIAGSVFIVLDWHYRTQAWDGAPSPQPRQSPAQQAASKPPAIAAEPPPVWTLQGQADVWRNHDGVFAVDAIINNHPLLMLFDTGAYNVVLRAEDAWRLGFNVALLPFTIQTSTANGIAMVAPVTLSTLSVGSITMHDVPAVVAKPGVLRYNLLGQPFLARLREYRVEGDRVIFLGR
jgi:clan AA aspartic protease (TIGR02281 family)